MTRPTDSKNSNEVSPGSQERERVFRPEDVRAFRFVAIEAYDPTTGTVRFHYAFDDTHAFVEEITFPGNRRDLSEAEREALDRCLERAFLVAGISYYKAAAPPAQRVEACPLSPRTADFLNTLYTTGLQEFAFVNGIEMAERVAFSSSGPDRPASSIALPRRTAVPLGGGKDSVVVAETIARHGGPMATIGIGNHDAIDRVARLIAERHPGTEHFSVERKISPELIRLNAQGAHNGHIPISAIYALILSAAAIVYGFDSICVGNERSANVGSAVGDGIDVNHQYSKSLEFERLVARHVREEIAAGLSYYSLLRPLSELSIAERFADMTAYHSQFMSCNAAFRVQGGRETWCNDCPKCRFVFLALAPFLEKKQLLEIFGANLLDDETQIDGFRALVGDDAAKPFECVGEIEESIAAFTMLAEKPEWQADRVVVKVGLPVRPPVDERAALIERVLQPSSDHEVPADVLAAL